MESIGSENGDSQTPGQVSSIEEFLFRPREKNSVGLFQGDLLERNAALSAALNQAHSYYATAESYTHFMVLTQSCDLVRRNNKPCKSRYITIAAARPLDIMVERELEKFLYKEISHKAGFPIMDERQRLTIAQSLERYVHNTKDEHFFIHKNWLPGLATHLCVFLKLSISIRAEEHYDTCLAAKIGQLQDIFAAKVGWMTGNLYSRIGTPDLAGEFGSGFDKDFKNAFVDEVLEPKGYWLTLSQVEYFKEAITKWETENARAIDSTAAKILISNIPTVQELLMNKIAGMLSRQRYLSVDLETATNFLSNNKQIRSFLRELLSAQ